MSKYWLSQMQYSNLTETGHRKYIGERSEKYPQTELQLLPTENMGMDQRYNKTSPLETSAESLGNIHNNPLWLVIHSSCSFSTFWAMAIQLVSDAHTSYLKRQNTREFGKEGLKLITNCGPEVAGGIHRQGFHEGSNVFQTAEHRTPCWQILFVVQTLGKEMRTVNDHTRAETVPDTAFGSAEFETKYCILFLLC